MAIEDPLLKYYNKEHLKNDIELEIKGLKLRQELRHLKQLTLKEVHGFIKSPIHQSDFGKSLMNGTMHD